MLEVVRHYAATNAIDLVEYDPPELGFNGRHAYRDRRDWWSVRYWPKSRVIGGDFMLLISEGTGEITRIPGY